MTHEAADVVHMLLEILPFMIHERLEDTIGEAWLAGDSLAYNGFIRRLHKVLDRMGSCGEETSLFGPEFAVLVN
jgi:hypothetical protein